MTIKETIGLIAGILALVGYVPYILSILRGKTLPNKATWYIWTLVGGLLAVSYIAEGDRSSIWVPISYFIGPLLVSLLSFKYGYSVWTKLDKLCILAAVISVIPWILLKNATWTLLINVFIDSTGAIPTVIKSYREPETEDFTAWLIFFIANTLLLFSISDWYNIAILYPLYLFFLAGSITLFTFRGNYLK